MASITPIPSRLKDSDVTQKTKKPPSLPKPSYFVQLSEDEEGGLPFCCGVTVLGKATYSGCSGDGYDECDNLEGPLPTELQSLFQEAVTGQEHDGKGCMLYSLTDDQVTEKAGLLAVGYQQVLEFKNPSTGNRVTLYAKLINQPRPRRPSRRTALRQPRRR